MIKIREVHKGLRTKNIKKNFARISSALGKTTALQKRDEFVYYSSSLYGVIMTGNDHRDQRDQRESRGSRRKSSSVGEGKMAAQSQGIRQLMAAEKEAALVVANARKSKSRVCLKI